MSRAPFAESKAEDRELMDEAETYVNMTFQSIPTSKQQLEIWKHQEEDDVICVSSLYSQSSSSPGADT